MRLGSQYALRMESNNHIRVKDPKKTVLLYGLPLRSLLSKTVIRIPELRTTEYVSSLTVVRGISNAQNEREESNFVCFLFPLTGSEAKINFD